MEFDVRKSLSALPSLMCSSAERKTKCTLVRNIVGSFHYLVEISTRLYVFKVLVLLVAVIFVCHYSIAALIIIADFKMVTLNRCLRHGRASHV